jgi:hypothetical protein
MLTVLLKFRSVVALDPVMDCSSLAHESLGANISVSSAELMNASLTTPTSPPETCSFEDGVDVGDPSTVVTHIKDLVDQHKCCAECYANPSCSVAAVLSASYGNLTGCWLKTGQGPTEKKSGVSICRTTRPPLTCSFDEGVDVGDPSTVITSIKGLVDQQQCCTKCYANPRCSVAAVLPASYGDLTGCWLKTGQGNTEKKTGVTTCRTTRPPAKSTSYCLVKVLVQPAINIWVGLPADGSYNDRFMAIGGGGFVGSVGEPTQAVTHVMCANFCFTG